MMVMLMPIGFVLCFRPLSDASLFLVLYGATAVYFSGVMVRLMLVLAPAACCLAAIAASELLKRFSAGIVAGARRRLAPPVLADATDAPKCAAVQDCTPADCQPSSVPFLGCAFACILRHCITFQVAFTGLRGPPIRTAEAQC